MYRIQDFFLFHGRAVAGWLVGLLVLAAAVVGGLVLLGGQDGEALAEVPDGPGNGRPCHAVVVDVGGSTGAPGSTEVRQLYSARVTSVAQSVAARQGTVFTAYFAGDASETHQETWDFAIDSTNDEVRKRKQTQEIVRLQNDLKANLETRRPQTDGSSILSAIELVAATTPEGCAITAATDGIENSSLAQFGTGGRTRLVADGAVERLIAKLRAERLIPDLTGRRLIMPALGRVAAGLSSATTEDRRRTDPRRRQMVRVFWQRYAKAAGTTLELR